LKGDIAEEEQSTEYRHHGERCDETNRPIGSEHIQQVDSNGNPPNRREHRDGAQESEPPLSGDLPSPGVTGGDSGHLGEGMAAPVLRHLDNPVTEVGWKIVPFLTGGLRVVNLDHSALTSGYTWQT